MDKITFEKVKELLGETGKKMTDVQIRNLMALMDNLSDTWIKNEERKIFNNLTIDDLLKK